MNRAALTLLTGLLIMVPAWAQSAFPAPDSTTQSTRPNIGYNFGQPTRNMQLIIDGRDWTNESNKNGNTINFQPAFDLNMGQHQVEAKALNILGLPVGSNWRFTIANPSNQSPANTPGFSRLTPALNSTTAELRPRISADYSDNLRNGRIWLDGAEQTSLVSLSGGSLSFTPNQDLSPGRHQVATQVTFVSGRSENSNWSFEVRPPAQSTPQQMFLNFSPPPGASIRNLRPYISADVNGQLHNLRLLVDNNDVTNQCERSANRIAWNPNYDLQPGAHGARVDGRSNGQLVNYEWNFTVEGGGQNNNPNTNPGNNPNGSIEFGVDDPTTGDRVYPNFDITGNGPANSPVRVVLRPLPKKNKVVQFNGTTDSQGYYTIPVNAAWATRGMRLEVTVTVLNKRGRPAADPIVLEVYRR